MNARILLIEDNEQNRYLATFLLEQHGHIVTHAPDGPTGVARAGQKSFGCNRSPALKEVLT